MPRSDRAFPTRPGAKLRGALQPPVERARTLVTELYLDEQATWFKMVVTPDTRGSTYLVPTDMGQVDCHVLRVANQRGAFTQGATGAAGHGPLTSASVFQIYVPRTLSISVKDELMLANGERHRVVSVDRSSDWEIAMICRTTLLGIDQVPQ